MRYRAFRLSGVGEFGYAKSLSLVFWANDLFFAGVYPATASMVWKI